MKQQPSAADLMQKAQDSFTTMLKKARHDPETARHLFHLTAYPCTDEKRLDTIRMAFVRQGVPLEFLTPLYPRDSQLRRATAPSETGFIDSPL